MNYKESALIADDQPMRGREHLDPYACRDTIDAIIGGRGHLLGIVELPHREPWAAYLLAAVFIWPVTPAMTVQLMNGRSARTLAARDHICTLSVQKR